MQKSEKFFIFSGKELFVLGLLAITGLAFCFTLGLHYGKQIRVEERIAEAPASQVEGHPEAVPAKAVLDQGAQYVDQAAQSAIDQATEKAVVDSGIKLNQPKPLTLPEEKTIRPPLSIPTSGSPSAVVHEEDEGEDEAPAPTKEPGHEESFAVQLGSYPSSSLARKKVAQLTKRGLKTEVRTAKVGGETRYRVILPGFKSRKAADQKGKELLAKRKIESFVVISSSSPR